MPEVESELSIDNLHLSIMIFSNEETAKAALNSISKDGSKIGHAYISWVNHPHIYQNGEMIVIYAGDSLKMHRQNFIQTYAFLFVLGNNPDMNKTIVHIIIK